MELKLLLAQPLWKQKRLQAAHKKLEQVEDLRVRRRAFTMSMEANRAFANQLRASSSSSATTSLCTITESLTWPAEH